MEFNVIPRANRSDKWSNQIEIVWRNLCYINKDTHNSNLLKRLTKSNSKVAPQTRTVILNNVSGSFRSGQLFVIMGPSGSGKTTLLDCVSLRKTTNVTGDLKIAGKCEKIRIGFVEQFDSLCERLTVWESIVFASRLCNNSNKYTKHNVVAQELIKKLGLELCADNLAINCSGGQRKKLSIALELVNKANVLILDEPTTGLDSVATGQLIDTLLKLMRHVSISFYC